MMADEYADFLVSFLGGRIPNWILGTYLPIDADINSFR